MVLEKQDLAPRAFLHKLNPPFSEEEMGRSKLNKHMQTQAAHCTGLSAHAACIQTATQLLLCWESQRVACWENVAESGTSVEDGGTFHAPDDIDGRRNVLVSFSSSSAPLHL